MAPALAETVFALGAGDRVVGVQTDTDYPPEAKALPKVGGHFDVNFERILTLRPDLIVVWQKHEKLTAFAEQRGIRTVTVQMNDLASIDSGIATLGELLDCEERATALRREIADRLNAVRQRVANLPKRKTLFQLGRSPGELKNLWAVGKGNFLGELIAVAGGENMLDDVDKPYVQVSLEAIIARAPEVIIEAHINSDVTPEKRAALIADWDRVATLPAVKEKRVHILTDDYLLLPGPRVALIAERLAEVIHPEAADAR